MTICFDFTEAVKINLFWVSAAFFREGEGGGERESSWTLACASDFLWLMFLLILVNISIKSSCEIVKLSSGESGNMAAGKNTMNVL